MSHLKFQSPIVIRVDEAFGKLFLFFAFTPWVHWGTNSLDSQPWPILFGLVYIATANRKFKVNSYFLAFSLAVLVFLMFSLLINIPSNVFLTIRGFGNYFTFIVVLMASYDFISRFRISNKFLVLINVLWISAALVEIVDPSIITGISHYRTTSERGLTSLAPEPTYFAIFLFFFSWILLLNNPYKKPISVKLMILFNGLSIIFLAQSAMGVLLLGIVFIALIIWHLFKKRRRKYNIMVLAGILLASFFVSQLGYEYSEKSRLFKLVNVISTDSIYSVVRSDASINARVQHVVLPIHSSYHNYFIPGGLEGFGEIREQIIDQYDGFFWYRVSSEKIMSWMGSFIFELGIGGVISILFIFFVIIVRRGLSSILQISVLFFILFSAVPLAFPLVAIVFSYFCVPKYNVGYDQR